MDTRSTGNIGENLACFYLNGLGKKVLYRNFRGKIGEIDVIYRDRDGSLVFLEVKAIVADDPRRSIFQPEDHLTRSKLERLRRICALFSAKHSELINENVGWRIDALAITMPRIENEDNLTDIYKSCVFNYYENI
ncbi:MAG: YraN family protein [Patescibacteria group bacterium]